jgi:hypothetical protein
MESQEGGTGRAREASSQEIAEGEHRLDAKECRSHKQ